MAQLKDLIVNGASQLIGNVYANKIQITTLNAPTSAGGSTYSPGDDGKVLKSNGNSIYWANDNNTTYTFIDKDITLDWGERKTIATIGGTDIHITLPDLPAYTGAGTYE